MRPRTPKEKAERAPRHGCVQAGRARIDRLQREARSRARAARGTRGPAYSKYLAQARARILWGKRRRESEEVHANVDPLFDRAVRRVHRRIEWLMFPIELLLASTVLILVYWPSRRLMMVFFLSFPLFLLVGTILRHVIRLALPSTDILIRREYGRLSRKAERP